jgi:hypothetical protein
MIAAAHTIEGNPARLPLCDGEGLRAQRRWKRDTGVTGLAGVTEFMKWKKWCAVQGSNL